MWRTIMELNSFVNFSVYSVVDYNMIKFLFNANKLIYDEFKEQLFSLDFDVFLYVYDSK